MFIHLRFIKPLVARTVGDVLGYGFGEKLTFGMLHDVADGGAQFLAVRTLERLHIAVGALACDGNGVDGNAARLRLFQRAEKTREGGFACTVMPVMATVSPSLMVMESLSSTGLLLFGY